MKPNTEPKIVKLYQQFFEEEKTNIIKSDEFFLLRPNIQHLGSLLQQWSIEVLQKKAPLIQALVSSILGILKGEQGLKLFNACQTLGVIAYYVGNKVESIPQGQCLFLSGTPEEFTKIFSQRFRDVIVGDSCLTLKSCLLNTLLTLWCSFPKCSNNPLIFALANDDIFDALITIFSFPDLKPLEPSAVSIFVILLQAHEETKQNRFIQRLTTLENNIGIIGIRNFINEQLTKAIENFTKQYLGENTNMLSMMTSKVFDLFGKDQVPHRNAKYLNANILLFLHTAVKLNRNIAVILTSPPHSHDHNGTNERSLQSGPNSNVFSLFLSFSSFVFADFDSKHQQDQAKLCLLILWYIISEPYVQSACQDMHLSTNISLYKSPMLHRGASFGSISLTPITLSTALLELLTDFNSTHLKHNFPFLHYHLSLSITHRVLIYHKKCKIRLLSWRPLFNSLVSIINYLSQNLPKLPNAEVFHLLYRVLLVVNFFITYGDTFLPDAAAYDFLYYEISRQSSVFTRLGNICSSDGDTAEVEEQNPPIDKTSEYFPKVSNQLINIIAIIQHIRPKLEVLSHTYPTEEQVINIVQDCFSDLTLKLYEGLENVEFKDEKNFEDFLVSLTEEMPQTVNVNWAEKIDYTKIAEELSNIEL